MKSNSRIQFLGLRPEPTGDSKPFPNAVQSRPGRILYVDDDPVIIRCGQIFLTRHGHLVETAADGFEAMACLEREPFDLLITDHQMPLCSGGELVQWLRDNGHELPVIVSSARADLFPEETRSRLRISVFLKKPFSPAALVAAAARCLSSATADAVSANNPRAMEAT